MAPSRRQWLQSAGVVAGGVLVEALRPQVAAAAEGLEAEAPAMPTAEPLEQRLQVCRPPGESLKELLRRNRSFSESWQAAERSGDPGERARLIRAASPVNCQIRPDALAEGQRPWASVLCCADSRVAPEWIFSSGPGELFEIRSAGNTAFDAGIASLEYSVAELAVPLILVMGHSGCGAVTAAMASDPLTPLLEDLVTPIRASLRPGMDLARAVKASTAAAARGLQDRSDLLRQAVEERRLTIQPAYFDIASGRVSLI